ncbi:MAG: cobyrinate a,c-diamide synthase [Lachnospiraceae bacterium]|jgi:cobyrinic acid a,c-diamide synthase|nr:cobyrinate a,c-diamide synthase [Lachnospiraceae bacterium]
MERERMRNLPRILFAAPCSGSGKTVITCGILEILKRREIQCVSYKCGPDYIDPLFHQYILGIPGYNLDSFFLPPGQVRSLFEEKSRKAQMAVIEGVMGFYDGVAGNTVHASAYEIAQITDTPVILIADGKKSSLSLVALVKGFLEYQKDPHICGVILNRTSAMMAERLRPYLEELGIRLYGVVPDCEQARWESRHLGLTLPGEQARLREKVSALADRMEPCVDVEGLLELAKHASPVRKVREKKKTPKASRKKLRRIAVARDEAFCFYYQENLDFLKEDGWELVYFSPLHHDHLPCAGISAILLGGGYPEGYAKELSENQSMLDAIRAAKRQGIKILAECGGFLYLHETLEGEDGIHYPMAGLIKAKGYRTERLSRFGYITLFDSQGEKMLRAHEFHYWDSTLPGKDWKAVKPLSTRSWDCMYVTEELVAGFPHLYYGSNPEWIRRFLAGGGG